MSAQKRPGQLTHFENHGTNSLLCNQACSCCLERVFHFFQARAIHLDGLGGHLSDDVPLQTKPDAFLHHKVKYSTCRP